MPKKKYSFFSVLGRNMVAIKSVIQGVMQIIMNIQGTCQICMVLIRLLNADLTPDLWFRMQVLGSYRIALLSLLYCEFHRYC